MNNKTNGFRPASRGYVNADGTVIRPKRSNGPPPSNAPQSKAKAVYGAPPYHTAEGRRPPSGAPAPPRKMPARPGTPPGRAAQSRPVRPAQPSARRPAASPRPGTGQIRPPQGQRPQRPAAKNGQPGRTRSAPSGKNQSGWIYPEGSGPKNGYSSDFDQYYRQRRQAEIRRIRQRQEQARYEALRKKKQRRKKLAAQVRGVLFRFVLVFLFICAITAGAYYTVFCRGNREKYNAVTYTLGTDDTFEASASAAYYDDVLYVDFTRLASFLDMPMAGSIHYMRFIIPSEKEGDSAGDGTEESVLFTVGSFTANINGVNMNMSGPCRQVGTAIWVPLSFVEHYMAGIKVEHVKADEITLSRTVLAEKDQSDKKQEEKKTEEIAFRVKPQKPIEPVVYDPNTDG